MTVIIGGWCHQLKRCIIQRLWFNIWIAQFMSWYMNSFLARHYSCQQIFYLFIYFFLFWRISITISSKLAISYYAFRVLRHPNWRNFQLTVTRYLGTYLSDGLKLRRMISSFKKIYWVEKKRSEWESLLYFGRFQKVAFLCWHSLAIINHQIYSTPSAITLKDQ